MNDLEKVHRTVQVYTIGNCIAVTTFRQELNLFTFISTTAVMPRKKRGQA